MPVDVERMDEREKEEEGGSVRDAIMNHERV
jgi:hypothetical protein